MGSSKNTLSHSVEALVLSEDNWARKMSTLKRDGMRAANRMREQGNRRIVRILSPKEVRGGDTIPLGGLVLDLDWKTATRLEMVESSRDLIDRAYVLESLDPGLPTVLTSIIQGKGLFAHNIGEFFLLYGRFEGKYGFKKQFQTKDKMEALLDGDESCMKRYVDTRSGESSLVPLPLAVRNTLAHPDQRNQLDPEGRELGISIDLLRSWVDTDPLS